MPNALENSREHSSIVDDLCSECRSGLLWYQHTGAGDGTDQWKTTPEPQGCVGTGWNFYQLFCGGGGVIYAVDDQRFLHWFRHDGYIDGIIKWTVSPDPKARPPEDVARDANRKPAEALAFAGVKPGDVVADYIANSGYFIRLFSSIAGPKGRVYTVELNEIISFPNVAKSYAGLLEWVKTHRNVTVTVAPAAQPLTFPRKLDLFWISQNYHDLSNKFLGPKDVAAFNRQVYAALKPGGVYVILDHSAAAALPSMSPRLCTGSRRTG